MLQRWQKEERARGKGLHRTCSEGRGALTGASGAAGTASAPPGLSAAAAGSSASPTMARGVARPQQKRIWPAHDCRQGSEWGRLTSRRPSGSSQGFRAAGPLRPEARPEPTLPCVSSTSFCFLCGCMREGGLLPLLFYQLLLLCIAPCSLRHCGNLS